MNRIFLIILCFVGLTANAQVTPTTSDSIKKALNYQIHNYPASQYRDIYKNFMQDFFGPGHIINNKQTACNGLQNELTVTEVYDGPDYEPTGYQGNFYRVNLRLINDGTIPYETFLNAFVDSVTKIVPPSKEEWFAIWNKIDQEISSMGLIFENEEQDRKELEAQLNEGNFMVHHSDRYNESVNFHYRIISRDNFQKIILPLLQSGQLVEK